MIRTMYATIAIVQVSRDSECKADKMERLLRLELALARCLVWREIAVVEERRRTMTDDSLHKFVEVTWA